MDRVTCIALDLPFTDNKLRSEYELLIPKSLHCCLDGLDPFGLKSLVVGAGVLIDGHPQGIALASVHTKIHSADIHILTINNPYANKDTAANLLQQITKLITQKEGKQATFIYPKEDPFSHTLEKVFLENSWQGPYPLIIECLLKRADFKPDWLYKDVELSEGFEEFLFKNSTQKEQKDLIHRYEQMSIPHYIFPFGREKNLIEYKNSLALRYKGHLIGWMITHRIAPDTIRYSALYIDEEFAYTGYWLKLLIDALCIHKNFLENVTYGMLEINLNQISKRWLKFIERRLFPHACKITHKQMFWKSF